VESGGESEREKEAIDVIENCEKVKLSY